MFTVGMRDMISTIFGGGGNKGIILAGGGEVGQCYIDNSMNGTPTTSVSRTATRISTSLAFDRISAYYSPDIQDDPRNQNDITNYKSFKTLAKSISTAQNYVYIASLTNSDGDADITINSIGTYVCKSGNYGVMVACTNLPEPVIVKPGETKAFTISIDFNKFIDAVNV